MAELEVMEQTRHAILKDRSAMMHKARCFFNDRGILEVDCPFISSSASVDLHIDLIKTCGGRFLHSSPEYSMKRLLSEGIGDIYQLSHVFRKDEAGSRHNPEFMMAEWYRIGFTFQEMIDETLEFITLFLGSMAKRQMSYRDLFLKYTGIDCSTASSSDLLNYIVEEGLKAYDRIESEGVDALLNLILAEKIEPSLGAGELFVLTHYPATQSALSRKTIIDEVEVAERFEVYCQGIELANGYRELCDASEQRLRLLEANLSRQQQGKETLPIDEKFLAALERGLPPCSGVAVGFDRLMMIKHNAAAISEVIPFGWNEA